MAQRYCPDCRQPVGLPNASSKQFEANLNKHRGSAKCKVQMAQNAEVGFDRDPDKLPYFVRFGAPKMRMLRVRLSPAEQGKDHGGNPVTTKRSRWAEFKKGQYETDSLFEVCCLRGARNNGGVLEQQESTDEYVDPHLENSNPDRFWEEGCFDPITREPVDPDDFAAIDVIRDRSMTAEQVASAG